MQFANISMIGSACVQKSDCRLLIYKKYTSSPLTMVNAWLTHLTRHLQCRVLSYHMPFGVYFNSIIPNLFW